MAYGRAQQKRMQEKGSNEKPSTSLPESAESAKSDKCGNDQADKMRGLSTTTYYDATGCARKK